MFLAAMVTISVYLLSFHTKKFKIFFKLSISRSFVVLTAIVSPSTSLKISFSTSSVRFRQWGHMLWISVWCSANKALVTPQVCATFTIQAEVALQGTPGYQQTCTSYPYSRGQQKKLTKPWPFHKVAALWLLHVVLLYPA